jgi:small subunit ribosomal protein S9
MINTSGRRKAAVARVYLKEGNGTIIVNKKALEVYFPLPWHQSAIQAPMTLTENAGKYDIQVNVCGGGVSGQAQGVGRYQCRIEITFETGRLHDT